MTNATLLLPIEAHDRDRALFMSIVAGSTPGMGLAEYLEPVRPRGAFSERDQIESADRLEFVLRRPEGRFL